MSDYCTNCAYLQHNKTISFICKKNIPNCEINTLCGNPFKSLLCKKENWYLKKIISKLSNTINNKTLATPANIAKSERVMEKKYSSMGNNKLIISIDFDNTIVSQAYPEVGILKSNCKRIINKWYEAGHKIIINTCRSGKFHGDCEKFLIENGISFNYINCNLPELITFYGADTRKISADVYIDDRNLGGLPEWLEIEKMMDQLFLEYAEM
jgi:hypothetical protein